MFDNWKRRRQLREQWESITLKLTSLPIDASVQKGDMEWIVETIGRSIARYAMGDQLNKHTLRLISVAKRVLADKRHFETVKSIDYLMACHNIQQYKMSSSAKKQVVAYFCSMAVRYLQISTSGQSANPFHAGQVLRRETDE